MQELQLAPDASIVLLAAAAAVAGVLLLAFVTAVLMLRRRRRPVEPPPVDLSLHIEELDPSGPTAEGPQLEFYGTPVRLAALILAPAGRNSQLPPAQQLAETVDFLVPGLAAIVPAHRTVVRRWPFQLSTQGFTHSFFNSVQLPGDRGRGTPWCSVAGRFETPDQQLLAGLVCVAQRPNSLGQQTVPHPGQWLDVLRVRQAGPGR
jgi:hypothetical protein